jgi:hypothetical protein
MINLEELILNLSTVRPKKNYIDGVQLYDDILIYMTRLNKFAFNINTFVIKTLMEIPLSSNEDIQRSFIRKEYGAVTSYVQTFLRENEKRTHRYSLPYEFHSRCHIYSLPYHFKSFFYLNNSFQGGMFDNVRYLMMTDFRPFEHNFFKVISKTFPMLKNLCIINDEPQKRKQQSVTCITFPHLIVLDLDGAHVDYAEQFLVNKHCDLPRLANLNIDYNSLALVTNNFTNDTSRVICGKLTNVCINGSFVPPENFHQYFPLL